mmetsp:Transcript_18949/g.33508  ORF Transcript_18949/g.33508 Transcript_18949/m.33508 type:complete len:92 (-) Transcript_18949:94-369(-)
MCHVAERDWGARMHMTKLITCTPQVPPTWVALAAPEPLATPVWQALPGLKSLVCVCVYASFVQSRRVVGVVDKSLGGISVPAQSQGHPSPL